MNEKIVYHIDWGKGYIINYSENIYKINFKNIGTKNFEDTAFGIYLFYNEKDMNNSLCNAKNIKETCMYSRYTAYKLAKIQAKNEVVTVDTVTIDNSGKTDLVNKNINYSCYILKDIQSQSIRNIVIVINQVIILKNRKYLKLIGIDVFTGIVVKIVDTNGVKVGYHTYNEKIATILPYTVIQSEFRNCENCKDLNIIRIKATIKILGKTNLINLKEKYDYIINNYKVDFHSFVTSFDEVLKIYESNIDKQFHVIVKFNNCLIKKHKDTYQLKMKNIFVNINNATVNKVTQLPYFTGYAVLTVRRSIERPYITSNILIGHYFNKEEFENIKKYNIECKEYEGIVTEKYVKKYEEEFADKYEIQEMYEEEYSELQEETERNGENDPYEQCDESYFYDVNDEYYND